MNRKTLIEIIIIVICFGGVAWLLYNRFFASSGVPANPSEQADLSAKNPADVADPFLYGDDLSGELTRVLGRNSLQYGQLSYPIMDPKDVGIPVIDLVKPTPSEKPGE